MNSETHAFYNVAASKGRFLPRMPIICRNRKAIRRQSENIVFIYLSALGNKIIRVMFCHAVVLFG